MRLKRPSHATVVAYLALFFAMGGTAVAATGSTLISGRANSATTTTSITNSNGTALALTSRTGTAPLAVSNTVKVGRLNADLVDGVDSTQLQRRVGATCPSGYAMTGINANGTVACTLLAPPPPAPAPAQSTDKGFAISDLQISTTPDFSGDWQGVCRITNTTSTTRTGTFTITIFRNNSVVATLKGSVGSLAPGNANTVDLYSTDAYSDGAYTTTFQTDTAYAG
jgi:hypothetical protein